jgi:hypothetical protein
VVRVRLRDILSSADRAAVLGLRCSPGQDQYLNSKAEIFAEAGAEQRAMPHPVGGARCRDRRVFRGRHYARTVGAGVLFPPGRLGSGEC